MTEAIQQAIQQLTIGYNIANEYFTNDDSNAGYKIGYIEAVVAQAIVTLQEALDNEQQSDV